MLVNHLFPLEMSLLVFQVPQQTVERLSNLCQTVHKIQFLSTQPNLHFFLFRAVKTITAFDYT